MKESFSRHTLRLNGATEVSYGTQLKKRRKRETAVWQESFSFVLFVFICVLFTENVYCFIYEFGSVFAAFSVDVFFEAFIGNIH